LVDRLTWGFGLGIVLWSGAGVLGRAVVQQEFRYSASQLDCAHFLETTQSSIVTESAGRVREQTSGRTAVWQFRAEPAIDQVKLEGWLDSLALWRKSKEGTIRPDTDGLLGGRYRGTLSSSGRYQSRGTPFVPDEVAEVADMGNALNDLFPPLPPSAIRPGQAWSDRSGVTLRRLADSGMSGVLLYRFELESRRLQKSAQLPGDTVPIALQQVTEEPGNFVWHPTVGLLRRERRIVVETSVPAGGRVRQPVHSKVEQRITLVRDLNVSPAQDGRCPAASS
jgi:hypothetical protein